MKGGKIQARSVKLPPLTGAAGVAHAAAAVAQPRGAGSCPAPLGISTNDIVPEPGRQQASACSLQSCKSATQEPAAGKFGLGVGLGHTQTYARRLGQPGTQCARKALQTASSEQFLFETSWETHAPANAVCDPS